MPVPSPQPQPQLLRSLQNTSISIEAIALQHLVFKPNHEVFNVFLRDIEHALKPRTKTDPAKILPEVYIKFLKVFSREEVNKLPPRRPGVDYIIPMQPAI